MTEREIFEQALEIHDPDERVAWLDRVCVDQPELRRQVSQLLEAHEQAGEFLNQPHPAAGADQQTGGYVSPSSPTETAGTIIAGRYKLLQRIGEGGMGSVWMADQLEPVKRRVAVKVIRAERDGSKMILSRFEAERQAIALMDHRHIAKLLDAGTTDDLGSPKPYFVMELVKGVPLTEFCDEHKLSILDRLHLFVQICSAIQHAHQKGIIHRDLKPTNILVELHDDKPVPKVIDFGLAKALSGQPLTEHTLFTGFGTVAGTPLYMAPEQAKFNAIDIDTRADVYALGVILYELLTGTTPIERETFKKAALDEMLRVIRELEPPTPSSRISSSESKASVAALRQMEPIKLGRLVRGELDWIVLKALAKERDIRYDSATAFAKDVERFLNHEPVQAGPPSTIYRFRKFLRRNKGTVIAASVILLCLLAGIMSTSAGLVWAVRERDEKAKALAAETKARDAEKQARDKALAALRALTDDIVETQMARSLQINEQNREFLRKIIKHFEGFAAITADDAESRAIRAEGYFRVGLMRDRLGELGEAETAYTDSIALRTQLSVDFPNRPEFQRELAATHNNLGNLLRATGRLKDAEAAYSKALALQMQIASDSSPPEFRFELAKSHNNLGVLYRDAGRVQDAETAYESAIALDKQLFADFPSRSEFGVELAKTFSNLGVLLSDTSRLGDAEAAMTQALEIQKQLVTDFPTRAEFRRELARTYNNVGSLFRQTNRAMEEERALAGALFLRKQLVADFPSRPEFRQDLAISLSNMGSFLRNTSRLDQAETVFAEALALRKRLAADFPSRPEFRQELAMSHNQMGVLLRTMRRPMEAETFYADALELQTQLVADFPKQPDCRQALALSYHNLGAVFCDTDRPEKAAAAYADALALFDQLATEFPNRPDFRNERASTRVNLAILRLEQRDFRAAKDYLEQAAPHHEFALKANPQHPIYRQSYQTNLRLLIQTLAGLADHAGAKQTAEKLRDVGWDPPVDAYNAACGLSLYLPIVQKDDQLTKEQIDGLVASYADQAMKMLFDAVSKGWHDAAHMKRDSDLDPLREREDFKTLLAELEARKKNN